jgi:hypothetical protein
MPYTIDVQWVNPPNMTDPPSQDELDPTGVSGAFTVHGSYDGMAKQNLKVQVQVVHPTAGTFNVPPTPGVMGSPWDVNFNALAPTPPNQPATLVANLYDGNGTFLVGSPTYYLKFT